MRPAFLLNSELNPVSCLIPRDHHGALSVGVEVKLIRDYTNDYGVIPAGTKGFVEYVNEESGLVALLMEGFGPPLVQWQNKMVLVPFDTDDLAACLVAGLRHLHSVIEQYGDVLVKNVTHLRRA